MQRPCLLVYALPFRDICQKLANNAFSWMKISFLYHNYRSLLPYVQLVRNQYNFSLGIRYHAQAWYTRGGQILDCAKFRRYELRSLWIWWIIAISYVPLSRTECRARPLSESPTTRSNEELKIRNLRLHTNSKKEFYVCCHKTGFIADNVCSI